MGKRREKEELIEKQQIAYKILGPDENTKWKLIVVCYLFINKIMVKCFFCVEVGMAWLDCLSFAHICSYSNTKVR